MLVTYSMYIATANKFVYYLSKRLQNNIKTHWENASCRKLFLDLLRTFIDKS